MTRKIKEVDLIKKPVLKKAKNEPVVEPAVVVEEKKPPTEKQLEARERAKVARDLKKQQRLDEEKQMEIEKVLKEKAILEEKLKKAEERKAKKLAKMQTIKEAVEKQVVEQPEYDGYDVDDDDDDEKVVLQKPVASTKILNNLTLPAKITKNVNLVVPEKEKKVENEVTLAKTSNGIFYKSPNDPSRGYKRTSMFTSSPFGSSRRIM